MSIKNQKKAIMILFLEFVLISNSSKAMFKPQALNL